ncbi:MAG: SUF system Fe-S cluster assembly protein [Pseudomonadota bacterium]
MFRWARFANLGKERPKPPPEAEVTGTLEERIIAALRTVNDPEIPVNLYDLGLIYGIDIGSDGRVAISMTLTAPACPVAEMMPAMVENAVVAVKGVTRVRVDLVWDPPWSMERMSEEAQLQLGML